MIDMATIATTPGAVIVPGCSGIVCKRCRRFTTGKQAHYQVCHNQHETWLWWTSRAFPDGPVWTR